MWKRIILCLLMAGLPLFGQGLFDSALKEEVSDTNPGSQKNFELNGYVRGGLFLGPLPGLSSLESKCTYGETSLKLRVRKRNMGSAFAEFRLYKDFRDSGSPVTVDLREAYVSVYAGAFDLHVGEQIVAWGRADGFNPTDTITPFNMLTFSPDDNDRRESNFLVRSFWSLDMFRLEAVWIPVYRPSHLPFGCVEMPNGVVLSEDQYPDSRTLNSGLALKLHFENPSIDGSLSYFTGYSPMPGIRASIEGTASCRIFPAAYRTRIFGADFSTTIGRYGLRGEFAYNRPCKKDQTWHSIPNPQFEYVLGIDREFGDCSLILQYMGKHVSGFHNRNVAAPGSSEFLTSEIELWNRMIFSQLEEWNHSLSFRTCWSVLHQTLTFELLGLGNMTTGEVFVKPKIGYSLMDDLNLIVGAQWYFGPENTLFGKIKKSISSVFFEIKASF